MMNVLLSSKKYFKGIYELLWQVIHSFSNNRRRLYTPKQSKFYIQSIHVNWRKGFLGLSLFIRQQRKTAMQIKKRIDTTIEDQTQPSGHRRWPAWLACLADTEGHDPERFRYREQYKEMLKEIDISHSNHQREQRVHAPGSVKKTTGNPVCSDTDIAPWLHGSYLIREPLSIWTCQSPQHFCKFVLSMSIKMEKVPYLYFKVLPKIKV